MYKDLDPIIHSPLRLKIISVLISKSASDFKELKELTQASSGNISVQLKKLEKAGYVKIKKGFMNNYQHTSLEITKTGVDAFEKYVIALKGYIGANP